MDFKLLNNGLIIQYGKGDDNGATSTITLPITYNTSYVCLNGGGNISAGAWTATVKINLSQLYIASRGTTAYTGACFWLTIGY